MRHTGARGRWWVAPYLALTLVVAGLVVFAVRAQGYQTHKAELNDGGVWVTNSTLGYYGRLNKPIGQLDGALFARADASLDIAQDGAAVVGVDAAGGSISTIDPSSVAVPGGSTAQVPVGGQVQMHGGTLAVLDPDSGKVWAMPVSSEAGDPAVNELDSSNKPLATVGAHAAMTVTASGDVVLTSAGSSRLTTLTRDGTSYARTSTKLAHQPGDGFSLTAVGDRVVLLDPATSTVTALDGGHAQVGADAVLQQPGPDADSVLVADGSRLLSVRLDDGTTSVLARDLAGTPAPPARLGACQYGAWGGAGVAGLVVTRCGDEAAQVGQLGAGTTNTLAFRINRGQIVLNDSTTGAVWNIDSKQPTRLDDWQSFQKKVVQQKKDDQQQTQTSGERTPPKAQPDTFGARPGRTTVLHPLDNDAAPDGRLLAISGVQDVRPDGADVSVSPDGQTVEIAMPARGASTTVFKYTINDGRQGVSAHATVTVNPRGPDQNDPPALRKGFQPAHWEVPAAGSITLPVLPDWRDNGDGDPLSVASAKVVSGPQGATAQVTASGQVRISAPASGGPATVQYGVTDGIAPPVTEQLAVDIQAPTDHRAYRATAEPDVVVGQAGKPITIHPLDNDLPGSDPLSPDASLKLAGKVTSTDGGQVDTDVATGTVTFRADQPKTYFLDYDAAYGNAPFSRARMRVDVRPPEHSQKAPVAMPDSLTLYGQSAGMVDVLANDVDPAGQVLVVQSATATTTSQLDVSVVGGRWVRIAATRPGITPNPQVVHYTISDGTRSSVEGDIVVTQRPEPRDDTPVTQADRVTVRAGSGTQVSVLDNDYSPDGEQLHLVTDPSAKGIGAGQLSVQVPGQHTELQGQAFVSGKTVRFNAPAAVTDSITETVTYVAANERGETAPGTMLVTILPAKKPNQDPEPTPLEGRVVAGDQVRLELPGSGVDPDGDPVSITGVASSPTLGRVLRAGADSLVYQAFPDSAGTDSFSYTVADPHGGTATGTVRVGVVSPAMPAAPVAVDDTATVAPGRTMTVDVLANDRVSAADRVTVSLLRPAPKGVRVDARTGEMRIAAPAKADGREVQVNYSISDGLNSSQATVTLRTQAGYDNPPVINDAYGTDAAGRAGSARVSVDVLKGGYDPDGPTSKLKVTSVAAPAGVASEIDGGTVTIDRAARPLVVPFVVQDADGGSATAELYVPPKGDTTPYVATDALIKLQPGQNLAASLKDYVVNPSRGKLGFTLKNRIWAAPASDISATITGDGTFTVHADKDYAGPGAVSFEVSTGTKATILTVPVQVGETKPVLRCPTDPIPVAQGQRIILDVTAICHVWTADPDQAVSYAADWKTSAPGLSIIDAQGTTISVTAGGSTAPGTAATLQLKAGSSDPAYLPLVVVAVPPPTLAPITIGDLKAGQSRTVDLAPYLHPGVPVPQPQVLSANQTTGLDVHAAVHGSALTLSSGAKANGKAVFHIVMSDVAGDPPPNRRVEGTLTLNLQAAPDTPSAPHPGEVDDRRVPLTWAAPQANGSPITSYEVRADHGGPTVSCPTTSCVVEGLKNGVDYRFQVRAINAVGSSDWSPASAPASPDAKPDPVTQITESAVGDGSITLHWLPPDNSTSKITYTVTYPGGEHPLTTSKPTLTISGLSNDNTYVFAVVAANAKGWASQPTYSNPYQSVGAPQAPAAPTITTTPSANSNAVVTVSWGAVDPNGPGPVRYRVVTTPYADGGSCTSNNGISGTSCTFSSIAYDGTQYTFKVESMAPGTGTGVPGGQARTNMGDGQQWKAVGLPGKWGGWSIDATGKDKEARITDYTVPDSHGSQSTLNVYRDGQKIGYQGSPGGTLTVNTPDNDSTHSFYLEVCNEADHCSQSAPKTMNTYGPLSDADVSVEADYSGNYDVGWKVKYDNNGKAGTTVTLHAGGKYGSALKTCESTSGIGQGECDLPPRYIGYSQTEGVTATISQSGRSGSGSANKTSNRTAKPQVEISRGAGCSAAEGSDPECGHVHLQLTGYGDGTGASTGSADKQWSCAISSPGSDPLNLSKHNFGSASGTGDAGSGDTDVVVDGYDGAEIDVDCGNGSDAAHDSMTWPSAPSSSN